MQDLIAKFDKAAVGFSLLCVVHCLLTPVAIGMLPALGSTFVEDERFHYLLLFFVLPTSIFSLGLGCRRHGYFEILTLGVVGLILLFLIVLVGEEVLGETGEKISTVAGALIIALAHIRNFKACRDKNCNSPKSD